MSEEISSLFVSVGGEVGGLVTAMATGTAAIDAFGEKSKGTLSEFSGVLGAAAVGAAAGLVGIGVEALKASADFSSAMELIKTQAGASQEEVDKMSAAVLNLAGPTATAPDELATALYHLESAGFRGQTALNALTIAAEGAKVGHANLEDVTNALDAVLVAGGSDAQNMGQSMGELNAIVGAGDMHMQDLADAMSKGILATAKTFGLNLQDVGAALATFGDNNIRGSQAATQLREAIVMMGAPSKAAAAALDGVGLSSTKLGDDMRSGGLIKALEDLKTHLDDSGKDATEQAQVMSAAFGGGKTSAAIMLLMQQLDRLKTKQAEIGAGAGQFGADWQATQKTVAFQLQSIQAEFDSLMVKAGTDLQPLAADLLSGISSSIPKIQGQVTQWWSSFKSAWTQAQKQAAVTTVATGSAAKGAGAGATTLLEGMGVNSQVSQALGSDVTNLDQAWKNFQPTLKNVGDIFKNTIEPVVKTVVPLLVLLFQWIIQVAPTFATWVTNFTQLVADVTGFLNKAGLLVPILSGVAAGFAAIQIGAFVTGALEGAEGIAAMIVRFIALIVAGEGWAAVQAIINMLMDANPIGLVVLGIALLVAGIVLLVTHWQLVESWLNVVWDLMKDAGSWIASTFSSIWTDLSSTVVRVWTDIYNTVSGWAGKLRTDVSNIWTGMKDDASNIGSDIWDGIKTGLNTAISLWDTFAKSVNGVLGKVGVSNVVPTISPIGSQMGGGAGHASSMPSSLGAQLGGGAAGPGGIGGQCVTWVEQMTGDYFDVAMASQMASDVNTKTPAAGDIGVSTIPPYGHTFIYLGNGMVEDSNWVAPLTVGVHALSDIPDIVGYIDPGKPIGGLASAKSGKSTAGLLSGITNPAGTSNLFDSMAHAVIGWALGGLPSVLTFDNGGYLPTGLNVVNNATGKPEPLKRMDKAPAGNITVHAHTNANPDQIARQIAWRMGLK